MNSGKLGMGQAKMGLASNMSLGINQQVSGGLATGIQSSLYPNNTVQLNNIISGQ